ncbi:MAG: ABC transporter ATP-binding protein [Acidimicrobiales bacterium]
MTWGTSGLTVRFGDRVVLEDVTISIEPGVVHAVIGGDGAGKSTLLRVLAGLGLEHNGDVVLPAQDRIGYMPSAGGVFGDLTVAENMDFVAAAYRLRDWKTRGDELLERAGLLRFGDRLVGDLSGGQRRKLAGSMALLPKPELLVLDEVTTGVDPVSRMELWRIIVGAAATGTAVVAATTYLDEAERAEHVDLLHAGRLLASGSPTSVIDSIPGIVTDEPSPIDRSTAWRHGRRWHQWHQTGATSPYRPTLEDAAIVHELLATGVTP